MLKPSKPKIYNNVGRHLSARFIHVIVLNLLCVHSFAQVTVFENNFEDRDLLPGKYSNGLDIKNGDISVVSNPQKDLINSSEYVMCVSTKETSPDNPGRAEYLTYWDKPFETEEKVHIYQWMVYFPLDYLDNVEIVYGDWQLISQFVTYPCTRGGSFSDKICGGGGLFNEIRINQNDYSEYKFEFRAQPDCNEIPYKYPRGMWVKLTQEILWTTSFNGYYRIWANEKLVGKADNVRTLPEGYLGDQSCGIRWKVGLYDCWQSETVESVYYFIDNLELFIDEKIAEVCEGCVKLNPCDTTHLRLSAITKPDTNNRSQGAINLSVVGGTGNYKYAWSNNFTTEDINGVPAANYTVTVTDENSCWSTKTINITNVKKELPRPPDPSGEKVTIIETEVNNHKDEMYLFDGEISTWWANDLNPAVATFSLDDTYLVTDFLISFYLGDLGKTSFSIHLSENGEDWKNVFDGTSSGETYGLEIIHIPATLARYIKLEGYGNNISNREQWTSIAEFEAWGKLSKPIVLLDYPVEVDMNEEVVVDASNSYDNLGTDLLFSWDYPTYIDVISETKLFIFNAPVVTRDTLLQIVLNVENSYGEVERIIKIKVSNPNPPPPPKPSGHKIPLSILKVSNQVENHISSNMLDNNLETRWSDYNDSTTVVFELPDTFRVSDFQVAFYDGFERQTHTAFFLSEDGKKWVEVYNGFSSGTSTELELFPIIPSKSKYIKLEGYGNNKLGSEMWTSITEFEVWGELFESIVSPLPPPPPSQQLPDSTPKFILYHPDTVMSQQLVSVNASQSFNKADKPMSIHWVLPTIISATTQSGVLTFEAPVLSEDTTLLIGISISSGFVYSDTTINIFVKSNEVVIAGEKPEISSQYFEIHILGNFPEKIARVKALDPEGGLLKYEIISGNDDKQFEISETEGELNILHFPSDSKRQSSYELLVKVTDEDSMSNSAIVLLDVFLQSKTVYINPENNSVNKQDGSFENPFKSWGQVSWKQDNQYLQKRNTVAYEPGIEIGASDVTIGAYGAGNKPIINSITYDHALSAVAKGNISLKDIDVIAKNAISSIYFLGSGDNVNTVENCSFIGSEYGIRVIDVELLHIRNCVFTNVNDAIYAIVKYLEVYYNLFKENFVAINLIGKSGTANIYNNVFYSNTKSIQSNISELVLLNNIFYLTEKGQEAITHQSGKLLSDYNIYYPAQEDFINIEGQFFDDLFMIQNERGVERNSIVSDPLFIDTYKENFKLNRNSPAVDAGRFVGLANDFYGEVVPFGGAPDIGMNESKFSKTSTLFKKESKTKNNSMEVFPNPSDGEFYISLEDEFQGDFVIRVFGFDGRLFFQEEYSEMSNNKTIKVNICYLRPGSYTIVVATQESTYSEIILIN